MNKGIKFCLVVLFLLFPGLSCKKEYVVSVGLSDKKTVPLVLDEKSFIYITSNKTQDLYFKKKFEKSEIKNLLENGKIKEEKNFIKAENASASLDIYVYKEGKEVALPKFLEFNPRFCDGILSSASYELLKGEQNYGKRGLLLPLFRVGCQNPDWAVFRIDEGKIYSLKGEELKTPLHSEGGGELYKGEKYTVIESPLNDFYATLSKKGKLFVYDWGKGAAFYDREGVLSYCFHPEKKVLYFASEEGLFALQLDSLKLSKLGNYIPRLMRISGKGSFIFLVEAGGENICHLIKLSKSGKSVEKEIYLSDTIQKADDWVFGGDQKLFALRNFNDESFILKKDLKEGKEKIIQSLKNYEISLLNSNLYPTITAKSRQKDGMQEGILFFNIKTETLEVVPFALR